MGVFEHEREIATNRQKELQRKLTCFNLVTDQIVTTHGLYCIVYMGDKPITNNIRAEIIKVFGKNSLLPSSFRVIRSTYKFHDQLQKVQVGWVPSRKKAATKQTK